MMQGFPRASRVSRGMDRVPPILNAMGQLSGWPNGARALDRGHPLAQGLVGWWPMQENTGTVIRDLGPYGNHGAWVGSTNSWVAGNLGVAVNLTGASGGYISIPSSASLQVSNAMTACIWAKRTSAAVNGALFHKGTLGASYGDWCMPYDDTSLPSPDFRIAYPASGLLVGSGAASVNAWHFVAATYDKINARLYVDGALVDTRAYTSAIAQTATPLNIGVYYDVPYAHAGPLAHARLYNRALSAAEIAQIYADRWAGSIGGTP